MKIKTQDLTGAALDWAVLEAMRPGLEHPERAGITTFGPLFGSGYKYPRWGGRKYNPSTNWSLGGPIIEREKFDVVYQAGGRGDEWTCFANDTDDNLNSIEAGGPTPLVAAMRCYVASKLGDEVDIPEVLA